MRDEEARIARDRSRLLRFLRGGTATVVPASGEGVMLIEAGERGRIAVAAPALGQLRREGLLRRTGDAISLTLEGEAYLKRDAGADRFAAQHREIELQTVATETGDEKVAINLAESPLAQLARRKGRDGKPFLAADEVRAGERLRADFTRGQIMPRLGANWVASVSSGRRAGGVADLTDAALAARLRVDQAMGAVGPELAGVLADICCFLKGMEQVEMERGWPIRSAKVVLKAALGALARHYEPPRPDRGKRPVLHWGAEGFRPPIMPPGS